MLVLSLIQVAFATNLCGLDSQDVDDVLDYYGTDMTAQTVQPFITAPLDCDLYGDLCGDLGSTNAEDVVCQVWDDMVAHQSMATIDANVEALHAAYENDGASSTDYECMNPRRIILTDSTHKMRGKSFAFSTGVYVAIGGSTKGWTKNGNGQWVFASTSEVAVSGEYRAYEDSVVNCFVETRARTQYDGFVQRRMSGSFSWVPASDHVLNDHTFMALNGDTCRNTFIWDSVCP